MALLAEVHAEALILLHERNYQIHKGVKELTEENSNLQCLVKKSDARIQDLQRIVKDLQFQNDELLKKVSSVEAESRLMRENSDCENSSISS